MDLRINETLQTGGGSKTKLLFSCLVGAVSNCAYAVRGKPHRLGGRKCLSAFRIHRRINGTKNSVPYELGLLLCPGEDYRREQRSLFPTTYLRHQN